ncbi:hypothetical protein B0T14DRAFT_558544 [Immersiella caudata]|uniref:Uncharacterized protein n=1 Tax=Immersiella caudata TaxID=314043 RepID=A0AA39WCV3_9PEZI|nr:hypothetical protein B0T14DRAFT_558544 [Immersiella caudata]
MVNTTTPTGSTSTSSSASKSGPAGCFAGVSSCAPEDAKSEVVPLAARQAPPHVVAAAAAKQREAIPSSHTSKVEANKSLLAAKLAEAAAAAAEAKEAEEVAERLNFHKVDHLDWAYSPPRRMAHGDWGDEVAGSSSTRSASSSSAVRSRSISPKRREQDNDA